jgi:hypothetical protein
MAWEKCPIIILKSVDQQVLLYVSKEITFMKAKRLRLIFVAKILVFLSSSKILAQLNFSPSSQHKCTYKENEKILVQNTCRIYRNHNGYFYSIQWPDGIGTGIDRVDKQTVTIDKSKKARLSWNKDVYYFKWENKSMIIDRFPLR